MMARLMPLAFMLLVAACGSSKPGVPADAQKLADTLSGDAKGEASDNPQCKMFTQAEAGKYLGRAVKAGRNAAMGTGCQWVAAEGTGSVMVQVVSASDHNPPSLADGFRNLPDVGKDGFVAPAFSGFQAGAISGDKAVEVQSDAKDPALAVALLKESMARLKS